MAKGEDKIELEGEVTMTYPGSKFQVKLTTEGFEDHEVKARLSGKMRMHYIKIVPGDKVKLQVSPYNLDQGLITYRSR